MADEKTISVRASQYLTLYGGAETHYEGDVFAVDAGTAETLITLGWASRVDAPTVAPPASAREVPATTDPPAAPEPTAPPPPKRRR